MVQGILDPFGGVSSFAALASDNTASCLNMREIISEKNPGIVSLNDQSHIENLGLTDISTTAFCERTLDKAYKISNFVLHHQYALSQYRQLKDQYNDSLTRSKNKDTPRPVL